MKILYITFTDFGDVSSGSGVRPYKMYYAFENIGLDVKLLEGQQNKRKNRKKNVKEINKWLDDSKPDFCYIEPPSGPWFNHCDLALLKRLNKMKVPIGIFYRDCYWLYPKWAGLTGLKGKIIILLQKRDLLYFKKYCDIIYFPSEMVRNLFSNRIIKTTDILPPGADKIEKIPKAIKRTMFYVGNVLEADGIDDLLLAIDELNQSGFGLKLIIITRLYELKQIKNKNILESDWVEVHEASGDQLNSYYCRSDLGILVKKRHFYMDMAVSVKIYEYMSHGLPILSTDCPTAKKIIQDANCGIICNDNKDSIKAAIEMFYSDEKLVKELSENAYAAAVANQWEIRAKKITKDLINIKGDV